VISPSRIKSEPVDESSKEEEEEYDNDSIRIASEEERDDFIIVPANHSEKEAKTDVLTPPASRGIFNCDYCLLSFKAKRGLTRHVQSHIKNWNCRFPGCNFSAKSKMKLNIHKASEHNEIASSSKSLKKEVSLDEKPAIIDETKLEIGGVKSETKEYPCFCGMSFLFARSLCAHKK
jgi:hypothetical protein